MKLKKLIWKLRYAYYMHRKTLCDWSFCWESATIATEECGDDWRDEKPEYMAQEELYCWID